MEMSLRDEIGQTLNERIEDLADLRQSYPKVAENIKHGQQQQKKLYDAKHGANKKVRQVYASCFRVVCLGLCIGVKLQIMNWEKTFHLRIFFDPNT